MLKKWLLALFLVYLAARLTAFLPFVHQSPVWSSHESFVKDAVPKEGAVRQSESARSNAGLVIGRGKPGFVEWKFKRPGPLPNVCQPYFIPPEKTYSKVIVLTPDPLRGQVLFQNTPLRYRAFSFGSQIKKQSEFVLRFEGHEAILESIRFFEMPNFPSFPWWLLLIAMVGAYWASAWNVQARWVIAVTVLAFVIRWVTFKTYAHLPLEGDALEYWALGQSHAWTHPWKSGLREPGFVWVIHLLRPVLGDSTTSLRFLGVLAGTACVPLVALLARAMRWSWGVGLAAALLVAVNPFAQFMSVQGYQLEVFTLGILLFALAWYENKPLALGLLGGLLCVTRVQSILAVLPLGILADRVFGWSKKERLRFWVPLLLLLIPYFIAVKQETGSVLGHLHRHAGAYVVYEAQDHGQSFADLPQNLQQFFFAPESVLQRTKDLVVGYAKIFFDPRSHFNKILFNSHYSRHWNLLFVPFFWLGLYGLATNKKKRPLLWFVVLFLNVLPMLHALLREPRLIFHVQPFFALITAFGGGMMWSYATRNRRSKFLNP